MDKIDLNELERLAKAALLPWRIYKECQLDDHHEEIRNADGGYIKNVCGKKDEYILSACNAVPELIDENRALQERAQMRQELVEQYEKDIANLRQKVRSLERQTVILASHLSKFVMHTMSTKDWLEWAERTAKEAGE